MLPALGADDRFDVVLMDIVMNRRNGDETCVEMRRRGVTMPVVAMTGTTMGAADVQRFTDMGFSGILPKPFSKDDVERVLRQVCQL